MSDARRLLYALVISTVLHFLVLVTFAPMGSPGAPLGHGSGFSLAGVMKVTLVQLQSQPAMAGTIESPGLFNLGIPNLLELLEPAPAPPWPVSPETVANEADEDSASTAQPSPPPSLSTESNLGKKPVKGKGEPVETKARNPDSGTNEGPTGVSPIGLARDHDSTALSPWTGASVPPAPPDDSAGGPGAGHSRLPGALGGGTAAPPAIDPPRCASCPPPPYPAEALNRELEGEVVLSVQVLPDGRVGDIFIEQSSSYPLLDEAAMTGVKTWTFYPAYQEGSTVAAVIRARIPFRLKAP